MSIRTLLALIAIPISLTFLPIENRQFWFYTHDSNLYAEHVIYRDEDSIYIIAKNIGEKQITLVDGTFGKTYYQESLTGQFVKLDTSNIIYPQTLTLYKGVQTSQEKHLVKIGDFAPIFPSKLRFQTPAEEELSIYIGFVILILTSVLVYTIVLFEKNLSFEINDKQL